MRVVIQRVSKASVKVEDETTGAIGAGLLLLVGFGFGDNASLLEPFIKKVLNLRIFSDDQGRFQRSLLDIEGEVLVVSQFTLFADLKKGRRPDFTGSLPPKEAEELYNQLLEQLSSTIPGKVQSGRFGAMMDVSLVNSGPVTITWELRPDKPQPPALDAPD